MSEALEAIGTAFEIRGRFTGAVPLGSGHIHDTFAATYQCGRAPRRYVHQRLNDQVFPDLVALMENLVRITHHQRKSLEAADIIDAKRRCLRLVPSRDGRSFHVDPDGRSWRTFHFLEGTRSCDTVENPSHAYQAARSFGAFAASLRDLPSPSLSVTIPGFHDLGARFAAFESAVAADPRRRAASLTAEIQRAATCFLDHSRRLSESGFDALPRRIVHNDCKINNVMLDDASDEGLCVIDLDTVMEGTLLYDFGELVRTATSRSPEDEPDPTTIRFDLDLFEALTRGYLAGAAPILDAGEIEMLPLAGPLMALENAIRFLTDHLQGDVYYRIHREAHNLDRFRAQMRLVELMNEQREPMRRIVAEAWSGNRSRAERVAKK